MSRTLSYRTGQSQDLKVGDTETELELICKDDDSPTDLSEAVTIQIKLGNYLGYLKSLSVSTNVSELSDGKINFKLTSDVVKDLPSDNYFIEAWVTGKLGTAIYPSEGMLKFRIHDNILSQSGSTITTISYDQFVQKLGETIAAAKTEFLNSGIDITQFAQDSQVIHKSELPVDPAELASKDYVDDLENKKVDVAETSGWQKQALFLAGDFKDSVVPNGQDFRSWILNHYRNPGVFMIRDETSGNQSDLLLISEGAGKAYWVWGVDTRSNQFGWRMFNNATDTGWNHMTQG